MISEEFLFGIKRSCELVLGFQLALYLLNLGEWYGGVRYMGSYNDPNQYAVAIFFSILAIILIVHKMNKETLFWLVVGLILIIPSASTGILLGLVVLLSGYLLSTLIPKNKRKLVSGIMMIIGVFVIIVVVSKVSMPESFEETIAYVMGRINNKLLLFNAGNDHNHGSFFEDRGWTRIVSHPVYLVFGAGEGYYQRFGTNLEIHSTIIGPLFYYGIVPFVFYAKWFIQKVKDIDAIKGCVIAALFVESLLLVNYRQPMFWIIFLVCGYGDNTTAKKLLGKTKENRLQYEGWEKRLFDA